MASEHGMIDPFSPEQVRVANGHKIVSYGTSSYGYDVRCADEFKIFTNINSTIVDPKNFDEKSFVDFKGPVCIIPPNSFALAGTVEFFRIPRTVLTVCLGKCVTGDTCVVDADTGAYVPITEMHWGKRTLAWDGWRLRPAKVSAFIPQGKREIFELRTRTGLRIRATANHPFRMLNRWVPLNDLRPGDRIAVAREIPVFGKTPIPDWEATLLGLMISEGQCDTPGHSPTYTTADPAMVALLESAMAASGLGAITYKGRYGYRLVNRKGRGGIAERNRAHDWLRKLRLNVGAAGKFVPQIIFTAPEVSVRLFLQSLFSGDGGVYHSDKSILLEYYSNSRRLIEDVHHLLLRFGIFSLIRERTTAIGTRACKIQITDKDQILRFAERIGFAPGSVKQRVLDERVLPMIAAQPRCKSNFDTLPNEAWVLAGAAARVGGLSLNSLDVRTTPNQSMPISAAVRVARMTGDPNVNQLVEGPVWDEVERIEPAGFEEVFDITVPTLHNFVANDFIVHNSTYARCFHAGTRVALVDGTAPTLEEMARRHDDGELFWGYSIGEHGRVIVSLLDAPRLIGRDSLVEIVLDNGEPIHATPDHIFLMRDGRTVAAGNLRPGDSLMPLYRDIRRGYESVYQPINGHLLATHRLADEWNLRHKIYADVAGTHRHHMDFDRRNNRPSNIERMPASEHTRLHNDESYGEEFDAQEHSEAIRAAFGRLVQDPTWSARYSDLQSRRAVDFWSNERFAKIRERMLHARRNPTEATRDAHRAATLQRYQDPAERARHSDSMRRAWAGDQPRREMQAEIARQINIRSEITAERVERALQQTGSIRGAARLLNCDRSVFRRFPDVVSGVAARALRNHKVSAVRELPGVHDVYCLTVPEAGNFALEAGVFVKNCGIIVNVTPLEPEWEGHVTLEFSNTTPLPAKIYANEGVAQMLFFESDEVCETSYRDRGGKYQGQRGVTLPKT
jgi:deoxycytidine triphosphate deaminase/intein/homing endonuclease